MKKNMMDTLGNEIVLKGVSTHNLKNIDVSLPKNKLITITGVSGSGKSSLAFHTIYKEGQFRYIESLSSYLRQFFNLGTRPSIEYSSGLSPAIAIEQNKNIGNTRSTVGTLTEIDDYLRLLFAKTGQAYSFVTGKPMQSQTIDSIISLIWKDYSDKKVYLLKESRKIKDMEGFAKFLKNNRIHVEKGKGFTRYLMQSSNEEISDPIDFFYLEEPKIPNNFFPLTLYGIFDRVTIEDKRKMRLKEDVIKILSDEKKFGIREENTGKKIIRYTDKNYCPESNTEYPDFTPQHFSFNRAEGACPQCIGIGEILQVDMDKVIDPNAPYSKAIIPWRDSRLGQTLLQKLAQKYSMDEDKLWKDLPARFLQVIIEGDNELLRINHTGKFITMKYHGIESILKDQYQQGMLTVDFQAMLDMKRCPSCQGAKLRKESLHNFLTIPSNKQNKDMLQRVTSMHEGVVDTYPDKMMKINIAELQNGTINALVDFLHEYKKSAIKNNVIIDRIITPLLHRASTITGLGLGYLSLHRQVGTLSGGEIQRLRLAKQLGNKLTGIIYVLDEPTIGLSPREIKKTIEAIRQLQEMGNTIVVVEHNEEFIKESDWVVEIGPGAGDFGGEVVYNGPYSDFLKQDSLTSRYLRGEVKIDLVYTHTPQQQKIHIRKAQKFNLQHIDVDIALGSFTIITGHSGAGKTTLMYDTLFRFLDEKEKFIQSYIRLQLLKQGLSWQEIISAPIMKKEQYEHYQNTAMQAFFTELGVDTISGHQSVQQVVYVDQTSIGKTPRSCPSTFVGTFDVIRQLYAGANEAKYLGFTAGHFSFNSTKGACPECSGYGYKKIELQFLPDTYVHCELCKGKRYKPEILDIKRRGKSISEVLDMYVKDALVFFSEMSHIAKDLELMCDIGLGYLKMGQPAHTLSGGESQRLKLVKHLIKSYKGHTLYFLDEPTVGLHPDDIGRLLRVLKRFLDNGDTILMIEHDEMLLQFADHVIELEDGKITQSRIQTRDQNNDQNQPKAGPKKEKIKK